MKRSWITCWMFWIDQRMTSWGRVLMWSVITMLHTLRTLTERVVKYSAATDPLRIDHLLWAPNPLRTAFSFIQHKEIFKTFTIIYLANHLLQNWHQFIRHPWGTLTSTRGLLKSLFNMCHQLQLFCIRTSNNNHWYNNHHWDSKELTSMNQLDKWQ